MTKGLVLHDKGTCKGALQYIALHVLVGRHIWQMVLAVQEQVDPQNQVPGGPATQGARGELLPPTPNSPPDQSDTLQLD